MVETGRAVTCTTTPAPVDWPEIGSMPSTQSQVGTPVSAAPERQSGAVRGSGSGQSRSKVTSSAMSIGSGAPGPSSSVGRSGRRQRPMDGTSSGFTGRVVGFENRHPPRRGLNRCSVSDPGPPSGGGL